MWILEKRRVEEAYIAIYGSRKTLIKSRPATTRVKFGCGPIKWSPTTRTVIDTLFKMLVIFSCARIPVKDPKTTSILHLKECNKQLFSF